MRRLALSFVLVTALATPALGQSTSSAADDQQRLLELKAAWVRMEHARAERDRYTRLFDKQLVSESEVAAAQTAYQVAQVTYQQRFLELFAATPRVSVARCVKSYAGEAQQFVTVTLRNSSAPALDYRAIGIVDDQVPMPDMERLREVANVFVSLTDATGTVISSPYELMVASIEAEASATVRFRLLKDVDAVRVALRYSGRSETMPVYLEKDAAANVVRMQSRQFSQEADLGSPAVYDLRLERYGASGTVFSLRVFELPEEVGAEFLDPTTGARLTQIKFTEGVNSQQLQLRVFLPDVVGDRVVMDQAIQFWAAALDEARSAELPPSRMLDAAQLDRVRPSAARLELVPRGVGRLEVSATSLFKEIGRGEPTSLEIRVRNIGTRRVDNVRLHADAPAGWTATTEPPLIERLPSGDEQAVRIDLVPPATVAVGDYPVRLRTEAYADNRRIDSSDQTARIQVTAPANLAGMAALVLLLVGVIGGIVWWAIRLTRR